jgi:hypothetical protein
MLRWSPPYARQGWPGLAESSGFVGIDQSPAKGRIHRLKRLHDGWSEHVSDAEELCDGLLVSTRQRKVRIRIEGDAGDQGPANWFERNEFEYQIP